MKRALVPVLVVSLSGCAVLNKAGISTPTPNLNIDAGKLGEAHKKAEECKAFAEKPVAWPEEVSIGGAVALSLAGETKGGVFVEIAPSIKDLSLEKLVAMKDVKPPPGTGSRTDLNRYVNTLGKGLAAFSDRPAITWTFAVLDSDTPNAFSAPGGYVFITTGMLKQLENEAQLAAVLAHEIGHITGRHALRSYQETKKLMCNSAYADLINVDVNIKVSTGPLPISAQEVADLVKLPSFNPNELKGKLVAWIADKAAAAYRAGLDPKLEEEADRTAAKIMIFAGYDTKEFEKVLSKLPDGGGFLTPHPSNKSRIATVAATRADNEGFISNAKAPALSPTVAAAK